LYRQRDLEKVYQSVPITFVHGRRERFREGSVPITFVHMQRDLEKVHQSVPITFVQAKRFREGSLIRTHNFCTGKEIQREREGDI
jgi:hypothetical protein